MTFRQFLTAMALMATFGGSTALVYRLLEPMQGGERMEANAARERSARLQRRAVGLLDQLKRNEFDVVFDDFAPALRNRLPPERLADLWRQLTMQAGDIRAGKNIATVHAGVYDTVTVGLETQLGVPMDLQVAFEEGQGIIGLHIMQTVRGLPIASPGSRPPPDAALPPR